MRTADSADCGLCGLRTGLINRPNNNIFNIVNININKLVININININKLIYVYQLILVIQGIVYSS